jgi:hypothetical protein
MMDVNQVFGLISYCRSLDPRVGNRDAEEMAVAVKAWYNALPVDMTPQDAQAIVHELHAAGQSLTPGAIGRRFDELHTPLHQQGLTRSKRPLDAPRNVHAGGNAAISRGTGGSAGVVVEIGSEVPSRPVGRGTTALLDELGIVRRRSPLRVPCPHCLAAPGQPCTAGGRALRKAPAHPSRIEEANRAQLVQ